MGFGDAAEARLEALSVRAEILAKVTVWMKERCQPVVRSFDFLALCRGRESQHAVVVERVEFEIQRVDSRAVLLRKGAPVVWGRRGRGARHRPLHTIWRSSGASTST
jgi:hypothetical protein